jgi:tetratricopeptide (TPR) repeat protein
LVARDGRVLTSASLLSPPQGGMVKTAAGDLHFFRKIVRWDPFQDLAVIQLEAQDLKITPPGIAAQLKPPETVWVGGPTPGTLREARLVETMPLSPRLVLMKLKMANPMPEPGAPVLNHRGELVGLLHDLGGAPPQKTGLRFFLARTRSHLNLEKPAQEADSGRSPAAAGPAASANTAFWQGVAASLRQDWAGARDKFGEAAAAAADRPEACYGRGVARYHLGDFLGARHDLEEAGRRLPGYALASLWLGKVCERQGNPKAAQEAYARAVALEPELKEAWFCLGELNYRRGDLEKAEAGLKQATGDFPRAARSWLYLGQIARARGRQEEALQAFKRAIRSDPDFAPAYLEGGKLLVEDLGRPQEAVALLKTAVRLAPGQPLPHYYLALAHLLSWNPGGAWEQYFALQEVSPDLALNLAALLEGSR